ncbi:MAG TPA: hypothetical protein VFO03_00600 [Gaiellaceae bacterium]|nr:hypothetical protein [Gaiellaceae bacterium]
MIETRSVGSVRAPRLRRFAGFVVIAVGSLWTLVMGSILWVMWELGGATGVGYLLLDMTIFGLTALGPAVVALGIWLVNSASRPPALPALQRGPGRVSRRSRTIYVFVPLALTIGAAFLLGVILRHDPYPFADVPKGDLIAYSGTGGVRLVRADGGRSWTVPGTEDMSGPEWTPDGERFAAVDFWNCCKAYSFARDGSDRTRLPANTDTTPVWSPDGRRLAVAGEGATGGIVVRPLGNGGSDTVLPRSGNEPAWSPDGKLIAFQGRGTGDLLQIYVVRPDGSGLRQLTKRTSPGDGASEAAWAPDGRRIAFTADFDGNNEIWVVRPDGSGLRKLTRTPADEMHPSWSPEGRRVAFARSTEGLERTAIVVLDLATGRETEIASAGDLDIVFEPVWQPAGAA